MIRAVGPLTLVVVLMVAALGCASTERPEVVPGSTIRTSSTTTEPSDSSTVTSPDDQSPDAPGDDATTSSTSTLPRLDPDDPNYPTTLPPPPRPTVSYPTEGG